MVFFRMGQSSGTRTGGTIFDYPALYLCLSAFAKKSCSYEVSQENQCYLRSIFNFSQTPAIKEVWAVGNLKGTSGPFFKY